MDLRKLNIKVFLEKGEELLLKAFIPVFHRWIQQDKLPGMLVDVAEYTHVFQGPGVLLIAHEGNYSLDETDGKRGLLYNQKRPVGTNEEAHLTTAFRRAFLACSLLENEKEFSGKLKFAPNRLRITLNDRLAAPHEDWSLEEMEAVLKNFLDRFYEGVPYQLAPEMDSRKLAGFTVTVDDVFSIEDLVNKIPSA
jgi:hypothetical protein